MTSEEFEKQSEAVMLKMIWEELREVRRRLDDHITNEAESRQSDFTEMKGEMSKLREEMAGHRTRLHTISAGIAVVLATAVSWFSGLFKHA